LTIAADFDHLWSTGIGLAVRMPRLLDNAAEAHRAGELQIKWVRDVVLPQFSGSPAGDVQKAVVERKLDVGDERRHGLESLEQGRELRGVSRFGGDSCGLRDLECAAFAVPCPDGAFKVGGVDHNANEAVLFR